MSTFNSDREDFQEYLQRCWTQQLVREAQEALAYYRVSIPLPIFFLNNDSQRYGIFDPQRYSISISRKLIDAHPWDVVIEILKHELAHALVHLQYQEDESMHGPEFQAACQRLGVASWARNAGIELNPQAAMASHRELAAEEEKLLRKVEKLLSLAASSNEHEASLAMQRARELCARHHLEALSSHKKQNYTYVMINHQKKQIHSWQWSILSILNQHFYVNCVSRSLYDAKALTHHRVVDVMGTRENVQMAEYAYWFLYHQLPQLFDQFRQDKGPQPRNARNSFYIGVLRGFDEKLKQQKRDLKEKTQEWGLVAHRGTHQELEARSDAELRHFVKSRYPSLSNNSGRSLNVAEEAFNSGKDRGRELNLHRALHQTSSGPTPQLKSATNRD
jgi:hypothetical protein